MIFQYGDILGAMAGLYMVLIILVVVFYIIGILIAVWVYKDAKKRDMNAAVWLLIVLVTGCIGCIVYLVIRNKE